MSGSDINERRSRNVIVVSSFASRMVAYIVVCELKVKSMITYLWFINAWRIYLNKAIIIDEFFEYSASFENFDGN